MKRCKYLVTAMALAGRLLIWSFVIVLNLMPGLGHDSCCAKAANMIGVPTEVEMVPDMNARQPAGWDEEEDGPWERPLIPKPPDPVVTKFLTELWTTLGDVSPWLLLGLLCSAVVKAGTPTEFVQDILCSGHLPVAKGAFLGLMSPLCSCSALPMALGLVTTGASPGAAVAFIVSAQAAGIDSLLFTVGVLGLHVALARTVAAALLGMAAGLVVPCGRAVPYKAATSESDACTMSHGGGFQAVKKSFQEALTQDFDEVAPSLLLGFGVTSLLTAMLPSGGLAQIALLGGIWGRASAIAVSIPLQFCEHASVPLAVVSRTTILAFVVS